MRTCILFNELEYSLKLDLKKTIFWVGAGASIDAPSKLPSGIELTEFYINHSLGKNIGEIFLKKWRMFNNCITTITQDKVLHKYELDAPIPRLEFIINCIGDVDNELQNAGLADSRVLYGLKTLDEYPPNANHYMLAKMGSQGATIITSNFDTSIERAFSKQLKLKQVYEVPAFEIDNNNYIFHFHGIANEPKNLATTIRTIKSGFPEAFKDYLIKCFHDNYNIVCIGYSGSDFFDVIPFFEGLSRNKPKQFTGKAIYFFHNKPKNRDILTVERMFGAFKNQSIYYGNTKDFLQWHYRNNGNVILDFDNQNKDKDVHNDKTWQSKFSELKKEPNDLSRKLYLISILKRTGLQLDSDYLCGELSEYKNIKQLTRDIIKDLLKINIREHLNKYFEHDKNTSIINEIVMICQNQKIKSKEYKILKKDLNSTLVGKIFDKSLRLNIDYVYKMCMEMDKEKGSAEIAVNDSLIQAYSRIAIDAVKCKNIQNIEKLIECGKILINIPYYEYKYISYYTLVYRRYYELLSINSFAEFENLILDTFIHINEIALEINALDELVKNYKCLARIYLYKGWLNDKYKTTGKKYQNYSQEIEKHLKLLKE